MKHLSGTKQLFSKSMVVLIVVLLFGSGCSKDENFDPDFKYAYFPVDTGRYVTYQVDSIVYDDFTGTVDTFQYQMREWMTSTFKDNEGRTNYRLERYFRQSDTTNWRISDVWFMLRTKERAEKIEENQRFIKLVFPPQKGLTWQGNRFINITDDIDYYEDWTYEITEVDKEATYNGLQFDSTLTVDQVDKENQIEKTRGIEVYAKGVGMIYKEFLHLEKQDVTAPWSEAESGFILRMSVVDYGKQ